MTVVQDIPPAVRITAVTPLLLQGDRQPIPDLLDTPQAEEISDKRKTPGSSPSVFYSMPQFETG